MVVTPAFEAGDDGSIPSPAAAKSGSADSRPTD